MRGGWPRHCSLLLTQPLYFVNYIVGRKVLPCPRLPHRNPLVSPTGFVRTSRSASYVAIGDYSPVSTPPGHC